MSCACDMPPGVACAVNHVAPTGAAAAPTPEEISRARAHRLLPSDQFNLNRACQAIVDAFGWHVFHVGSSLRALTEGTPWRDIDVRCMLDDDEFDRMFPGAWPSAYDEPTTWRLTLMNTAMSEWLAARTGLPIDFQFQRLTQANAKFPSGASGGRSALGIFPGSHAKERPKTEGGATPAP